MLCNVSPGYANYPYNVPVKQGKATVLVKRSELSLGHRNTQFIPMFIILRSVDNDVLTNSKLVLCTAEEQPINSIVK